MKVVLIGPYPPPHGGVSVHLSTARRYLEHAGIECRVINLNRGAPESAEYARIKGGFHLAALVCGYALRGWTVHVHISGHNTKSWLVALVCAAAGWPGRGAVLTIHSGMMPGYLKSSGRLRRALAGMTSALYSRVICVNEELLGTISSLGVRRERLEVIPAYLGSQPASCPVPAPVLAWLERREPVLSTVLCFQPEYAFELIVDALAGLTQRYPRAGLLVMGDSKTTKPALDLVALRGLGNSVLPLGDVQHDLCLALMARSDLFVRATLADGDAVSVREALSLGIPVVASNVGARPAPVLLFEAGDAADLLDKLETALALRVSPADYVGGSDSPGPFGRLLEIYGQVGA